jgi:hypothetical protein
MDAVEHDVHVRVLPVVVRDDQCLMILQPKVAQRAVRNAAHRLAVYGVAGIEAYGEVIDGLLHALGIARGASHQARSRLRIARRQVARFDPVHALGITGQIPPQTGEVGTNPRLADHGISRVTKA